MIGAIPVFHGALADAGGFLHPHPPACFSTCGWLVWPFQHPSYYEADAWRIRKMCTHAYIYPCCHHDGTRWFNDGEEYSARLDKWGPTMGSAGQRYPSDEKRRGVAPWNYPTHNVPDEWPWVDDRNGCWDFAVPFWFTPGAASDWSFETYATALLEIFTASSPARRARGPAQDRENDDYPACGDPNGGCFTCHVPAGAAVALAMTVEIYKRQLKATKAYEGAVTNIFCHLTVSFCSPLPRCEE
jgi:hypothetical protein